MRRFLYQLLFYLSSAVFFMHPEQHAPTQENPFLTLQHIMELAEASIVEGEIHYWASLGPSPKNLSLEDLESRADELLGHCHFRRTRRTQRIQEPEDRGICPRCILFQRIRRKGRKRFFSEYMVVEREQELQSGARARLLLRRWMRTAGKQCTCFLP